MKFKEVELKKRIVEADNINNININDFIKQFNKEYAFLYKKGDNVAGYDEAIEAFDDFQKNNAQFVSKFIKSRGDFISSDREAGAFMFALETMLQKQNKKESTKLKKVTIKENIELEDILLEAGDVVYIKEAKISNDVLDKIMDAKQVFVRNKANGDLIISYLDKVDKVQGSGSDKIEFYAGKSYIRLDTSISSVKSDDGRIIVIDCKTLSYIITYK